MGGRQVAIRGQGGFSTMDLMLVLALTAVIGSFAFTTLTESLDKYRLSAAAQQLASELESARGLALARGTVCQIAVNAQTHSFQVVDLSDPTNPVHVRKTLGQGAQITGVPNNPIRFFPKGNARAGIFVLGADDGTRVNVSVGASGRTTVSGIYKAEETG